MIIKGEKQPTIKNTRFKNNRISVFGLNSGVVPLASIPGIGRSSDVVLPGD
jgi:hypothetical protein